MVVGSSWCRARAGQALLAILIGAVIGICCWGWPAIVGSDRAPDDGAACRAPLGVRGSYLPTVLNIVQLIGWAALEVS